MGAKFEADRLSLADIGFIRVVEDPPNVFELAGAMDHEQLHYSAVDRYAPLIRHELAVVSDPNDVNVSRDVAWALVASLRIRTAVEFLVPMTASHSWATLGALKRGSCRIQMIEDFPRARQFGDQPVITFGDCEWVGQHFKTFSLLYGEAAFRLATDCFCAYPHHANLRMATADLWAGVESLFGISSELRFRIASLTAAFLEPPGESRFQIYRRMKSLYDFRSKAVHGAEISDEDLTDHVIEVRLLLSRLLVGMIEGRKLPSTDDLERSLFGV